MLLTFNESVSRSIIGVEKVLNSTGKYVVIGDKTSLLEKTQKYDTCDWAFLPGDFFPSGFGIALPDGSPYTDYFSSA